MRFVNEEKPLHQQTTIPALPLTPEPTASMNARPVWPPAPRPRPRQGPSWLTRALVIALAVLLVSGGLAWLVYATTNQYSRALGERSSEDLTATVRSRLSSQATTTARERATAVPMETANAQIYATATVQAQPSATAAAASAQSTATIQLMAALLTKVTGGTPALNDPLTDNSQGNTWDVGYIDNNDTGCNFVNSSYQVLEALSGYYRPCFADATNFSNFAYQASMTMNSACAGGLILRGNKNANQYYLFTITTTGSYRFELYDGNSYFLLSSGTSAAILSGTGQVNELTVIADQGVFDLFVNQTFVGEAISGQLRAGQIGVVAYNLAEPASINFSDAEVWKI